jgi:hypothetical protein
MKIVPSVRRRDPSTAELEDEGALRYCIIETSGRPDDEAIEVFFNPSSLRKSVKTWAAAFL